MLESRGSANAAEITERSINVGVGRDYADVSPLKEIYSDGDDRSGPVVEITRLAQLPPESGPAMRDCHRVFISYSSYRRTSFIDDSCTSTVEYLPRGELPAVGDSPHHHRIKGRKSSAAGSPQPISFKDSRIGVST